MFKLISHSPQQTESAGEVLGKRMNNGGVLALFGPMGMGKTVLTRGIVRGLGSLDSVSSPTFAIVNVYTGKDGLSIRHFDMYRIKGPDDLESTGYYDYLSDGGVMIIEWSENVVSELPDDTVCVVMERGESENERIISVGMLGEIVKGKGN